MGCDIHLYIEIKTRNGWELYSNPKVERDYLLFALMANVRNKDGDIKPVCYAKGLPKDCSYLVSKFYEYWELDAHNMSWLSLQEYKKVLEEYFKLNNKFFKLEVEIIKTYFLDDRISNFVDKKLFPYWVNDIRFVFWFDN